MAITPEIREVMQALHYQPCVSIILPFNTKLNAETELFHSLKIAMDKAAIELEDRYPNELGKLVVLKLRKVLEELKIDKKKKSIAIFVSPVYEKTIFLDLPVEEKIIVDESFEVRDLIYDKKQSQNYLVLILSTKSAQAYVYNHSTVLKLNLDIPDFAYAAGADSPERVSNFSDPSSFKEKQARKVFRHADAALHDILQDHDLPVLLLGTEKVLGQFKGISKNRERIIAYIEGNYESATRSELIPILEPAIQKWKRAKQDDLLDQLEIAAGKKTLVTGMQEVWSAAEQHRGRLLVVEKDFIYTASHAGAAERIEKANENAIGHSLIKDAVDDVIEKVLAFGGDVEFVEPGFLEQYQHIALIQFYYQK